MRLSLLASVVLIGLLSSAAQAQNNFFNNGVGLFNPVIDTVQSGSRLVVQPTVSADRKYVTLSGSYQQSQVVAIQNFPFFGVQGGGNVGGGGAPVQQNIQLPQTQFIGGDFNVSVPVSIQRPGPGPVLHQQGMFLLETSPP
jgi:hypothetical protein